MASRNGWTPTVSRPRSNRPSGRLGPPRRTAARPLSRAVRALDRRRPVGPRRHDAQTVRAYAAMATAGHPAALGGPPASVLACGREGGDLVADAAQAGRRAASRATAVDPPTDSPPHTTTPTVFYASQRCTTDSPPHTTTPTVFYASQRCTTDSPPHTTTPTVFYASQRCTTDSPPHTTTPTVFYASQRCTTDSPPHTTTPTVFYASQRCTTDSPPHTTTPTVPNASQRCTTDSPPHTTTPTVPNASSRCLN